MSTEKFSQDGEGLSEENMVSELLLRAGDVTQEDIENFKSSIPKENIFLVEASDDREKRLFVIFDQMNETERKTVINYADRHTIERTPGLHELRKYIDHYLNITQYSFGKEE